MKTMIPVSRNMPSRDMLIPFSVLSLQNLTGKVEGFGELGTGMGCIGGAQRPNWVLGMEPWSVTFKADALPAFQPVSVLKGALFEKFCSILSYFVSK